MIEKSFWNGFFPLLLTFAAAQLTIQADIIMLARLGAGAPSAYAMLMRVALLDFVSIAAIGAVTSIFVSAAARNNHFAETIRQISALTVALGAAAGVLGVFLYPRIVGMLAGESEIAALARNAIIWYALAAPFRFFASSGAFALHALGRGVLVIRWKLIEVALKAGTNLLFIDAFLFGFTGCFIAGFVISVISACWFYRQLPLRGLRWPGRAERSFTLTFLHSLFWEAQRNLSPQLALFASFALFAAPWLGHAGHHRLDPYATGQILMLFILAPMAALTRFLAFRLTGRPGPEIDSIAKTLWIFGIPLSAICALIVFLSSDWLGHAIYRQQGPWWSALVQALSILLPLRYAANIMRAVLQARGSFAAAAAADILTPWLAGIPLIAVGLYLDCPVIAYLSFTIPEAICIAWLWYALSTPRRLGASVLNYRHGMPPREGLISDKHQGRRKSGSARSALRVF